MIYNELGKQKIMKKNILKLTLAVAVAAGYTTYASRASVELAGVAMDNVEALASGENWNQYKLCPCPSRPGAECRQSTEDRPACPYPTYC